MNRNEPTRAAQCLGCSLLLLAVEQVSLPATYVRNLVPDAGAQVGFIALCGILCLVTACWLYLCIVGFGALESLLGRSKLAERIELRWWLLVPAVLVVGGMVLLCQDRQLLRPALGLGTIGIATVTLSAAALCVRWPLAGTRARRNAWSLLAVGLMGWYLVSFSTLNLFRHAMFGAQDQKAVLRTAVTLGIPLAVAVFSLVADRARLRSLRPSLQLALLLGLVVLQWVNASVLVDLHLQAHCVVLMLAAFTAWQLSAGWLARLDGRAPWLTKLVGRHLLLAGAAAVAALLWMGSRTASAHLAAQHTVVARYTFELVFEEGRGAPDRWYSTRTIATRLLANVQGRALPITNAELPETFATLDPDRDLPRPGRRNVVLFFLDMKRERDIDLDAGRTRTPQIAKRFANSVRLTQHSSNASRTMSVFPAIYSSTHGGSRDAQMPAVAHQKAWWATQNGRHNLVDLLAAEGYHTRVLTNRYYMTYLREGSEHRPAFGAFDQIVVADESRGENRGLLDALDQNPTLIDGAAPFLLVVHILSHPLSELEGVDEVVGRICDRLETEGRLADAVLALTADHGVQFQEHGRTTYGRTLFQEELHVPMLWRIPGVAGGTRAQPTSSLDILPTLADALGVSPDFPMEGRSLLPLLHGRELPPRPVFFAVRRFDVPVIGVRLGPHKLMKWLRTGTYALFDIERDPGERVNLVDVAAAKPKLEELDALLREFQAQRLEPF